MRQSDDYKTLADEIRDREERIKAEQEDLARLKQERIDELLRELDALGWRPPSSRPARVPRQTPSEPKDMTPRRRRACAICRGAGLEGSGHNARGHARWLDEQDDTTRALFRGQQSSMEPRLVRTARRSE